MKKEIFKKLSPLWGRKEFQFENRVRKLEIQERVKTNIGGEALSCRFATSSPASGRGRKCAFTLAEVLITLTIIGVIAALTIPNLMQRYDRHIHEVKIKKFVAQLANNVQIVMRESNCDNIACALSENGINYGQSGIGTGTSKRAPLKLFFKNAEDDISNKKCTYAVTDVYYLNGTKLPDICAAVNGCTGADTAVCVDNGIGIMQTNESFREAYTGSCINVSTRNNWNGYSVNGACGHFLVFLDGKSKKPIVGKNVFSVRVRADGTIASTTYKMTKEDARQYPLKALFYLQQNSWQMDYLE